MTDFDRLKEVCRLACHERGACRTGFEALLRAETTAELMQVWRQNWQDIYQSRFSDVMADRIAEFSRCEELRREMRRADVFVNESSERGLVIVSGAESEVRVGGTAKCYVFGDAPVRIVAADHAQVYCRNRQAEITLRGKAYRGKM